MTAYAGELRISEITRLKISDIDSRRMVLRVDQGKGQKDRYVMLSPQLLEILRHWWRVAGPDHWLFPGNIPGRPISKDAVEQACQKAHRLCGIRKPITPHSLPTRLCNPAAGSGTDVRTIQLLLGHRSLGTGSNSACNGKACPGGHDGMGVVVSRKVGRSTELVLVRNHEIGATSAASFINAPAVYDNGNSISRW